VILDDETSQGEHSDESEDELTVTYRKHAILMESLKNESLYMGRTQIASFEDRGFYGDDVGIKKRTNQQVALQNIDKNK
jgi:hypothetical protein